MIFQKKWLSVFVLCALSWGCDTYFHEADFQEAGSHEAAAPQAALAEESQTRRQMLHIGRVVLDRGEKEARFAGEVEPVRVGTDAYRVIVLKTAPEGLNLNGARVLDARVVAEGAVVLGAVVLGADRVLRHHTRNEIRELDTEVLGPLSVEAGRVAYVRGEAPDLRLMRADLEAGEVQALAPKIAPVWSPALSVDGREVIFAASRNGQPELLRLDAVGELHRISSAGRTPSSPVAPVWRGDYLEFEDEAGKVRLNLVTGEVESLDAEGPKERK